VRGQSHRLTIIVSIDEAYLLMSDKTVLLGHFHFHFSRVDLFPSMVKSEDDTTLQNGIADPQNKTSSQSF